jgi:hypothetical protein
MNTKVVELLCVLNCTTRRDVLSLLVSTSSPGIALHGTESARCEWRRGGYTNRKRFPTYRLQHVFLFLWSISPIKLKNMTTLKHITRPAHVPFVACSTPSKRRPVFWDTTAYSPLKVNRCFGETSRLHVRNIWSFHGGDYVECSLLGYKNPFRTSQETPYVSATDPSRLMLCNIWAIHGGDYEEYHFLHCYAVWLI